MSKLEEYGLEVVFTFWKNPITKEESYTQTFSYSSNNVNRYLLDELKVLLMELKIEQIEIFVGTLEYLRDYKAVSPGYIHEIVCPVQILFTLDYHTDSKMLSIDHTGGPTSMPIQDLIDILKELKVLMEKYP